LQWRDSNQSGDAPERKTFRRFALRRAPNPSKLGLMIALLSPRCRRMAQVAASTLLVAAWLPVQNSAALTVTAVTSDNGYPAHKVQWTDSAGLTRTAIMVDQNLTTPPYTGYLRQYTYVVNGVTRVCTGTDNYATGGNLEFSGDGFVQNHTAADDIDWVAGDNSSGNGAGVPGTTTNILQGASHAIIQYSMPNYTIYGPYYLAQGDQTAKTVPTTIQWFFADGRSHPIFSISQDARNAGGNLGADSRSPYGDMAYDGDGVNAYVGGASYGDTYKFVTLGSADVSTNSGWMDTQANTIPYAMQWADTNTTDAEMGHVATLPILVSDAGMDSQYFNSEASPTQSYYDDPRGLSQPGGKMIPDQAWAYQIFAENPIWPADGSSIKSKRLTWGANWGRVGGFDGFSYGASGASDASITNYTQHSTDPIGNPLSGSPNPYKGVGNSADGSVMAYSVFVVFGTHTGGYTNGTVGQEVIQMQNATQASLSATIGAVATNGPAGVGNAASRTIPYTPAGYNPTYSTWEIAAKTNTVNATLAPAANAPLDHPIFVINGYTSSQLPASIAVGTRLTNASVDYFATLDTAGQRLWISVNRMVSNSLNLVVNASAGTTPAPVISSFSPTNGAAGTSVVITGQNLTNASAVAFNGVAATQFTVNSATQITATVPAGATTGLISVTTPGGTAQSAASFTVPAAPVISSFSPTGGPVGTSVVITGQNLTNASAVAFNGVAAVTFTVNSATQITATVPAGATTGLISVTTPGGTAASATVFTVAAAPVISSFSPTNGAAGTSVVITGQNLTNASSVAFNGVAASFTVNSATQITATVPAGATTGLISVTTPGGTAHSAAAFTVPAAPASLAIYTNSGSLLNGFQDWSWATDNLANTSPVYSGSDSISVTAPQWDALALYYSTFALNTAPYASLSFWINGGAAGAQGLQVMGVVNANYVDIYTLPALAANAWTEFNIPLSALGVANITNCQGFWFWPSLAGTNLAGTTTFYVASIQLNSAAGPSLAVVSSPSKAGSLVLQLSGLSGQTYWMQTSTNLATWTSVSTNVMAAASVNITNTVIAASSHQFWRAVWPPQ
jgi:hypothetical protein